MPPPEIVDDGWAFFVEKDLCYDPHLVLGHTSREVTHFYYPEGPDYAEGVDAGRFAATGERFAHTGWSIVVILLRSKADGRFHRPQTH